MPLSQCILEPATVKFNTLRALRCKGAEGPLARLAFSDPRGVANTPGSVNVNLGWEIQISRMYGYTFIVLYA